LAQVSFSPLTVPAPNPHPSPVTAAPSIDARLNPSQKDFPDLRFWFKRDYTKVANTKKLNDGITGLNQGARPRGRVRLVSENENVMNDFIELEDGTIVDGTTAENIRARFRDIFAEQKKTVERMQETMPESWGQASVTFKKFLIKEVYEQFPYMRWCDNDWKVHFLATRVYSNWLKAQRLKETRMRIKVEKKEDILVDVDPRPATTPAMSVEVATVVLSVSKCKASPALDIDDIASSQGLLKKPRVTASSESVSASESASASE
jgi:hypothetical protein